MSDKPKRGRRTKQEMTLINAVTSLVETIPDTLPITVEAPVAKKRGRKPKGGKIIQQNILNDNHTEIKSNIILHLKCSLKDIEGDPNKNIESFLSKTELYYQIINQPISTTHNKICAFNEYSTSQSYLSSSYPPPCPSSSCPSSSCPPPHGSTSSCPPSSSYHPSSYSSDNNSDIKDKDKEIWRKLKTLEHNLHVNNLSDKKSACFWCSYDFDNNPIYIPKHAVKETYHVYGCFCSPECATAYLMDENLDSSTKFERYYLLNHLYTKIYNYTKNIKPAPNPHYMLDKFYGNLTIQQYRALLKSERLFLIVDKPLTRILPEFHEDNDEFIINNKIIPINNNVKKSKPQTKNNIVSEHFGLNA